MRWRWRALLIVVLTVLAARQAVASDVAEPAREDQTRVEMAYTSTLRLRPPMSKVLFDVILRNPRPDAQWYLLPYALERPPRLSVDVVEVYELRGTGRVVVGHLGGLDGMYAVLLPGGGRVRLRGLPLHAFDEAPPKVRVEAVIASDLRIGGEPATNWFGTDPLSDRDADVDASALRDQAAVQSVRYPESGAEAPVDDDETERIKLDLDL